MIENVFDILEKYTAFILWVEIMRMDDRLFYILTGVLGVRLCKKHLRAGE
jgi:hypothetical protein